MLGISATLAAQLGLAVGVSARAEEAPAARELMRAEKQIQANLQNDRDLANNRIDVRVSGDVATLTGTVDSEAERSKAVRLSSIAGIRVIDDQLKVESVGMKATVTDGAVTAKIKGQFFANTDLRQADIRKVVLLDRGAHALVGRLHVHVGEDLGVDPVRPQPSRGPGRGCQAPWAIGCLPSERTSAPFTPRRISDP